MAIARSGPPTTHDSQLWRVPLTAPPSAAWQEAFQSESDATSDARASGVQFERAALTFCSDEVHVPRVNRGDRRVDRGCQPGAGGSGQVVRTEAARAQAETDALRRQAGDANEKSKAL
jgi:hypothetical protein